MSDNDAIAAILKAGKDIPVLVGGVDNTATSADKGTPTPTQARW